jgi:hypothetical protein
MDRNEHDGGNEAKPKEQTAKMQEEYQWNGGYQQDPFQKLHVAKVPESIMGAKGDDEVVPIKRTDDEKTHRDNRQQNHARTISEDVHRAQARNQGQSARNHVAVQSRSRESLRPFLIGSPESIGELSVEPVIYSCE